LQAQDRRVYTNINLQGATPKKWKIPSSCTKEEMIPSQQKLPEKLDSSGPQLQAENLLSLIFLDILNSLTLLTLRGCLVQWLSTGWQWISTF
jgi:hypothetical protein